MNNREMDYYCILCGEPIPKGRYTKYCNKKCWKYAQLIETMGRYNLEE